MKITDTQRKRAKQRNFVVNTGMYTSTELEILIKDGEIEDISKWDDFNTGFKDLIDNPIRIFMDNIVSLDWRQDDGFFSPVAQTYSGAVIYIDA